MTVATRMCAGCDHLKAEEDLAPYQRNADGTHTAACRGCITSWIALGILWDVPFWARKAGLG